MPHFCHLCQVVDQYVDADVVTEELKEAMEGDPSGLRFIGVEILVNIPKTYGKSHVLAVLDISLNGTMESTNAGTLDCFFPLCHTWEDILSSCNLKAMQGYVW